MPTVLISGANRGLGLEFARQYAADGWSVIAGCRTPGRADALNQLAQDIPHVEAHALDVIDSGSVAAFRAAVEGRPIDVLIAGAGVYGRRPQSFGQIDYEDWLATFSVNTLGPIRLAEAFTESLKATRGKLVAISSLMGSIADSSGGELVYRASKAALNAAFKGVALALKPDGVTAMVIHPGWVATDMGGERAPVTPAHSIAGMRRVIGALTLADAGGFKDFQGRELPW